MPAKVMLLAVGLGVGGTETHILELASRIDRSKYDVTVGSLKPGGRLADELRSRGVRVVSFDGMGKLDARVLFRLWRFLRRERPDVIQAFLMYANVAARIVGRLFTGVRVISSYHDEVVAEGWLIRMVDRLTVKWTHAIVCCSEAVRRSVSSCIGGAADQYSTIYFGVDTSKFVRANTAARAEVGLLEGVPVIGTVCRLIEPKKGLSVLLSAVAHMKRRSLAPECQLLIIGDGPARESLQAMCDRLGISGSVVFAGVHRDIPRLLRLFTVFVLPSLYEGFGIAILEAMAAGVPVVATRVGGIPEFVIHEDTGLLVAPADPEELADAIHGLLASPERAERMGRRAQAVAQMKFGIDSIVRQHERLYEACVNRSVASAPRLSTKHSTLSV
jgi:glycosyltransferase involved in cell wall biosynthesis